MPTQPSDRPVLATVSSQFHTTHWSVVVAAQAQDSVTATTALEQLCRVYWYPVYSFARRLGHPPQDSEDLTQGFFAHFLAAGLAGKAERNRGSFRSFLLATFKHFRSAEWDRARAQRRGGAHQFVSWELHSAEGRFGCEPIDKKDPERSYEWNWAMALLENVLARLQAEFDASGKQELFDALK